MPVHRQLRARLRGPLVVALLVVVAGFVAFLVGRESGRRVGIERHFDTRTIAAAWCTSGRGLQAQVQLLDAVRWATGARATPLVLIDDVPAAGNAFTVSDAGLTVCVPAGRLPTVMAFGVDTDGYPLEFNSAEEAIESP